MGDTGFERQRHAKAKTPNQQTSAADSDAVCVLPDQDQIIQIWEALTPDDRVAWIEFGRQLAKMD